VVSIGAMGELGAEWSARFRTGGIAAGPGDPVDRARTRTGRDASREPVPPPPVPVGPPIGAPTEAPVWSVTDESIATEPVGGPPPPQRPAPSAEGSGAAEPGQNRRSIVVTSFAIALLAFYLLEFAVAFLSWYDAEMRTPGQSDSMVAWALCALLLLPALLMRGRGRALPLLLATVAGAVAPVLLSRDLVGVLGIPDVWVGQALTLHVVFPLCLGLPATVAALLPGGPGRR
jgi:hypothetical protein